MKQFQLDQIVIGNQAEVNLQLQDSTVSPIHALIEKRNETFYLCDLGSTEGTFKGEKQILDEVLESGEDFIIGPFRLQFSVGAPRPVVAPPDASNVTVIAPPKSAPPKKMAPPPQSESAIVPPALTETSAGVKVAKAEPNRTAKTRSSDRPDLKKTFAPPSAEPEENLVVKPSKGSVIEVSVGWKERIIQTFHYRGNKAITIGSSDKVDIELPSGVFSGTFVVVDFQSGVAAVNLRGGMEGDLLLESGVEDFGSLKQTGRLNPGANGLDVIRLEQGEAFRLSLVPDLINIYVRYVPSTQKPTLLPFFPFTTGEISTVLAATALIGLLALYNAIHAPIEIPKEEQEPQIISVTKFVYPTVKPKVEPTMPNPPTPPPVKIETPPKEKQKVVLGETTKAAPSAVDKKADSNANASGGKSGGSKAAEAAPNKNVNAKKNFTSLQQGGGVKLGEQAGANASQTQKPVDLSTVGLTSTFGGGGARSKLAQAVQGAGGIIGDANQATGTAGFAKNRPGDDLGSAFKDTGAGGHGVATEGISGGITNGRGSGNSGYGGVGSGLGSKGGVSVDVGGQGASFVGTIDRNAVLRVIRSKHAIIRRCYEKELRFKKELGGRVVLKFEIAEGGRVASASVDSSTLGDPGVENCLKNELVTWQFPDPPPNSVAEVLFPFTFQNKE